MRYFKSLFLSLPLVYSIGIQTISAQRAVEYDRYFVDKTIRVDYVFSGDEKTSQICLDDLSALPHWAGRRHNLNKLPIAGNGQITMTDKATGDTIYRTSFSTLFQEWQTEPEAQTTARAFENTYLLPYPKEASMVTVELRNKYHQVVASYQHEINPSDILIHQRGNTHISEHRYLVQSGSYQNCIDVVIMAEGYTEAEKSTFYQDAERTTKALFAHKPFCDMKDKFNIIAVWTPSQDSDVSVPRNGAWKNTAVGSHFDTFYSDRYLTTRQLKRIHNWLAGIPYEHIIILANTEVYGGGGIYNAFTLTTAHHKDFEPVVVHEFGHSFAGLGDEYAYSAEPSAQYPYEIEPWEQNITTLVHFDSKWKDMLPPHTAIPTPISNDPKKVYTKVGVYEGAGYSKKGIYRPAEDCRMRTNAAPDFCPVCQRAIQRLIRFHIEQL